MQRVGFVGAGRMGAPMVERLAAAGHDLLVHARSAPAQAHWQERRVATSADLADVATGADAVIVAVFTDAQLVEVAAEITPRLGRGSLLISHVTGAVDTLDRIAADNPQASVVSAPVSGTPDSISAGELTVLLGGDDPACEQAEHLVGAYANAVLRMGPRRAALAAKLVNNFLMAANAQLVAEGLHLGAQLGVQEEAMLAALQHMSGASQASRHIGRYGSPRAFADGVESFLAKDVAACIAGAAELGGDPGLLAEVVARGQLNLA